MMLMPGKSHLVRFLLAGLVLSLATPTSAATIAYSVVGSTNDFQGTIDVNDLGLSIATFSNINFITATGYGSEPIGFFGTNSNGWVTYYGEHPIVDVFYPAAAA